MTNMTKYDTKNKISSPTVEFCLPTSCLHTAGEAQIPYDRRVIVDTINVRCRGCEACHKALSNQQPSTPQNATGQKRVKDKFRDWTQNTEHRNEDFAAVSTDSTEDSQR
eukprot:scaffold57073_cov67-Cyclotella_meneghiniana.AAC.2